MLMSVCGHGFVKCGVFAGRRVRRFTPTHPAPPAKLAGTPIRKVREGWGTRAFVIG
jgi:hypothetical protein